MYDMVKRVKQLDRTHGHSFGLIIQEKTRLESSINKLLTKKKALEHELVSVNRRIAEKSDKFNKLVIAEKASSYNEVGDLSEAIQRAEEVSNS